MRIMSVRVGRRSAAIVGSVALGLGSLAAACGGGDEPTSTGSATTGAEATTEPTTDRPATTEAVAATDRTVTTGPATTGEPTTGRPTGPATTGEVADPGGVTLVNVYWGWTVGNPPAGSPERIGAGARTVGAATPVRNSLEAMFRGTNGLEQSIGMTTSIPSGTTVLGIAVDGSTATVDLSGEFTRPGGSLDEAMRLAQVVFAVTQFDGFERVRFHIDGVPRDPLLSHGFVVGDGLTRDDFPNVRPTILVEQPHPGAQVSDPLTISGESNTFEGTVRYAITSGGGDGVIVAEGFTTATAGSGIWGDFAVAVDLVNSPGHQPGPGAVIMWEESARDGSRLGVVEVPIVLPER